MPVAERFDQSRLLILCQIIDGDGFQVVNVRHDLPDLSSWFFERLVAIEAVLDGEFERFE